ncbi:MAG: hypothetical protein R3B46_04710 [Phycisphaerales bacterium]
MLALENSRSFAESPIGGGPIVRVGDRMSTFSPALTAAVCAVCETLAKEAKEAGGEYKWQRRLMPGGVRATAFQAYGYEATCVCLPLGNYHNMADLDLVEQGDEAAVAHARCGREYIGVEDYHGLIEMLIACATRLDEAADVVAKMEKAVRRQVVRIGMTGNEEGSPGRPGAGFRCGVARGAALVVGIDGVGQAAPLAELGALFRSGSWTRWCGARHGIPGDRRSAR